MTATKIKKIVVSMLVALVIGDVTLLFAANHTGDSANTDAAMQNFDAFAKSLTTNTSANTTPANNTTAAPNSVAVASPSPATTQQNGVAQAMAAQPTPDQVTAFNQALAQSIPMTPQQIIDLKQQIAASEKAASQSPTVPPKPVSTSILVNLAPGTTPPVIRLAQGFISSLVITDSTGRNWPIQSIDNGNPDAFNIAWDKKGNTVMIQALKAGPDTYGNIAITLQGSSTPIMLTLMSGQKVVDYRADLRVSALSPASKKEVVGSGLPASANPILLSVLDGVPPGGSKALTVTGCATCQAWTGPDNHILLRLPTGMTLLSPGALSFMESSDHTGAYEIDKINTLLVSDQGKVRSLGLS